MARTKGYDAARVDELSAAVMRHKALYYAGKPEISDAAYDKLEDELRKLAPTHPALSVVGSGVLPAGAKVAHEQPMLSLAKTYDLDELKSWVDGHEVIGTLKVDGISLSLVYEGGALVCAKTRGNGRVGEDVTSRIGWVADVLPTLTGKVPPRLEVRGELYCTESRFVLLSEEFAKLELERPTSTRNVVAGVLGRKSHVDLMRYFNFFAFNIVDAEATLAVEHEFEAIQWLEARGFRLPFPELIKDASGLERYLESVKHRIENDEIGIDGAVFSFNELARHRELGNTSHHPRYKMSYKWQGETATSTIRSVTWATSRLGVVTPVAVIEPVNLSGATITNVTLHNAAHVKAYNLKPGDKIEIVRSGEVIPKFLQVIEAAKGEYEWPARCPSCNTKLEFDDVRLRCPNGESCSAQQLGTILNWIVAAEIDDLSEKRLVPLMDAGKVKEIPDLYKLERDDFFVIPQVKDKMADKLLANVAKSRTLTLTRFLTGLGIQGTGDATWERLLAVFPDLPALQAATADDIVHVEGFAEKTAQQIEAGLAARAPLIKALLKAGVTPTIEARAPTSGALGGKTFVITGELGKPRADVEKAIKRAGGKTAGSVSKNTFAVVTNDPTSTSGKMKKARELGVKVMTEAELDQMLGA